MKKWYKITELENIPSMGSRVVEIGDLQIAIFKTRDGSIFAINNTCPHKKGKLSEGLVHETIVTCPLHNLDINLENGKALEENAGCVKKFETKIENNIIYLNI